MHIKNLVLCLLAATNILCLFIIFGKHANRLQSDMTGSNDYIPSKEALIENYDPTGGNCGAAISLSKRGSFPGSARLDMVCLIQGSRTVIWRTLQDVKNEMTNEYRAFAQLAKAENIQELDDLSYRSEGKRNALLFAKQGLLYKRGDFAANDFLKGYLLGYDFKDIEFFYQRDEFRQQHMKKNEDNLFIPSSYADFSPELKKEFGHFKEYEWPMSKSHSRYELDKKKAIDWLDENEALSDDQLYQQIRELKRAF